MTTPESTRRDRNFADDFQGRLALGVFLGCVLTIPMGMVMERALLYLRFNSDPYGQPDMAFQFSAWGAAFVLAFIACLIARFVDAGRARAAFWTLGALAVWSLLSAIWMVAVLTFRYNESPMAIGGSILTGWLLATLVKVPGALLSLVIPVGRWRD